MAIKDSLNVDTGREELTPVYEVVIGKYVMGVLVVKLVDMLMGSMLNLGVLKPFVMNTCNDVDCRVRRLDSEYCRFELEENILLGRDDVVFCMGRISGVPCADGDADDVLLGGTFLVEEKLLTIDLIETSLVFGSPIRWLVGILTDD